MPPLRLELTLETVTPLFLAGADPRGTPELRPPSLRGALRYWLRAAVGGVVGDNVATVRAVESAVFGSAADGSGSASAVTVRVAHDRLPTPLAFSRQNSPGRDYLYWSMSKSGSVERGNYVPPKYYLPPGTEFKTSLAVRPGVRDDEAVLRQAVAALWLLIHLGGVGSRSRRTGGSLSIKGTHEHDGLRFHLAMQDTAGVAEEIGSGLRWVSQHLGGMGPRGLSTPGFDVLHPDVCRIWVLGVWDTSAQAVEAIGAAMRDFRTYREPDHTNVARWLTGGTIATVHRSVFGLPLPFRYSDGGPSGVVQGRRRDPAIDRRASPIWLKVSKTTLGRFVGVATLFRSAFLPRGEKLHAAQVHGGGGGPVVPINPPPNYDLIETWITGSFRDLRAVSYV